MTKEDSNEEVLTGGNASASVVRIDETVRKPWLPSTERTVAYMLALRDRDIDIPEPRGQDDAGRLVLDYVPGDLAMDREPLDDELQAVLVYASDLQRVLDLAVEVGIYAAPAYESLKAEQEQPED